MSYYYDSSDTDTDTDTDTEDRLYFIKYNAALQNIPNTTVNSKNLNGCASNLLDNISARNNRGWTAQEKNYDCIAVGATSNNRLIVSGNVKARSPSETDNHRITYSNFGLHDRHKEIIQRTICSEPNKYGDFNIDIIQQKPHQNKLPPEINNARDHAEMQIVSYAQQHGLELLAVGTSKPPCAPCKEKLEQYDIGFRQQKDGNPRPKNWEAPENVQTQRLTTIPRSSVRVTKNVVERNIPESRKQAGSMIRNNVKQQLIPKPGCHVSAGSVLDTIDRIDQGGSARAGTYNAYSGTYESERTLTREGHQLFNRFCIETTCIM